MKKIIFLFILGLVSCQDKVVSLPKETSRKSLETNSYGLVSFIRQEIANCECSVQEYAKMHKLNPKTIDLLVLNMKPIDNVELFNEISNRVNYKYEN